MGWWTEKRYRMIQNNLRDIDAGMDVDRYVETLVEFGADVCMVGCGGITSFYPTELSCQKRSPYLRDDFFGRLLDACHKNGIRVIARFDFSKTHESFLMGHPEWYSVSVDGERIRYNDTVATCVNGAYQQECSLQILEEVIRRYSVDGVFFNMFGYQTRDYSGRYVGICQCDNCRKKFFEYSGYELPKEEREEDPIFQRYKRFRADTVQELLKKIYARVKELNPEVAVCTYSMKEVDLVRSESNSAVDRPLPFWMMESESNVELVQDTFAPVSAAWEKRESPIRLSSNCVINAVDIFYRFMGVSPQLNELRLWGNLAAGGNLDWCIIGGFETYPDRTNFEGVKRVFRFHKRYGGYYNTWKSCAQLLVVKPEMAAPDARKEYLGIYKILKESHIMFDVADAGEKELLEQRAACYRAILLPALKSLPESTINALKESGAVLVGTGLALESCPEGLKQLFGIRLGEKLEQVRGSYMMTEPKGVFSSFPLRDWVYLDGRYRFMEPEKENRNYLPLIKAGMYGPPERCFGYEITQAACVSVKDGKSIYFPWMLGELYYSQGYEDFKQILLDVLRKEIAAALTIQVDAPPCAEIFWNQCGKKQYLLQVLNYSGFNGMTFSKPLKIDVKVKFPGFLIEEAKLLGEDGEGILPYEGELRLEVGGLYQAVLITGEEAAEKNDGALV